MYLFEDHRNSPATPVDCLSGGLRMGESPRERGVVRVCGASRPGKAGRLSREASLSRSRVGSRGTESRLMRLSPAPGRPRRRCSLRAGEILRQRPRCDNNSGQQLHGWSLREVSVEITSVLA
jgi:hypothetical protein